MGSKPGRVNQELELQIQGEKIRAQADKARLVRLEAEDKDRAQREAQCLVDWVTAVFGM